ncbi:DUF3958 family protein [Enterococcus sp. BWR-S5]|uniref:DUF3958 family protein n=1 Tax=Enterococcus sp. BWR-S5 TaxID=2787714 RepID=UPI001920FBB1|nr:DUF3958 family protein [Enterococcus sp. BWR-S5]MBL1225706.1 DUF3958 family protein [Enterococcus sp. BWR-S5]
MKMIESEEQINRKRSEVADNQAVNRKKQWRLEELEQDCQPLSLQHEAFLANVLQSMKNEEIKHYFSAVEDEVREIHRHNFYELERNIEELRQEEKQLIGYEEELLWERKERVMNKEDEKEFMDGA